jgi:hypothetical protein
VVQDLQPADLSGVDIVHPEAGNGSEQHLDRHEVSCSEGA